MSNLSVYVHSSIGKKQVVAATGLALILFVVGHLAGNLTVFAGPQAVNHYAEKLAGFRPALNFIEAGLAFIFIVHMLFTFLLVVQNARSRESKYQVKNTKGKKSLSTRLMPISGIVIFVFVILHLLDFTFVSKGGMRSFINGESYGLFGILYNSFKDPVHAYWYVIAMMCVGLHLHHGISSFAQTFGLVNSTTLPKLERVSSILALVIAFAYSAIPIYILYFCTY